VNASVDGMARLMNEVVAVLPLGDVVAAYIIGLPSMNRLPGGDPLGDEPLGEVSGLHHNIE
jgi:hypothetical protein